jgi:hypothetical protein
MSYWYGTEKEYFSVLGVVDDTMPEDVCHLPCLDGEGFFHLGSWRIKQGDGHDGFKIWSSLLLKTTDEALGIYQRIGIVHIKVEVNYEDNEGITREEFYIPEGWVTRTVKII